jgi:hypothetical protein
LNETRGGIPPKSRPRNSTDAQIDDLVYELYGITDEERKLIEEQS